MQEGHMNFDQSSCTWRKKKKGGVHVFISALRLFSQFPHTKPQTVSEERHFCIYHVSRMQIPSKTLNKVLFKILILAHYYIKNLFG